MTTVPGNAPRPAGPVAQWPHPVAHRPGGGGGPLVDYHAHVVLEGVEGRAGALGPESGVDPEGCPFFRVGGYRLDGVRYDGTAFRDLDLRLEAMATLGIDAQVLSPNPLTYFHHVDATVAIEFCRWHNDAMADLVARAPDRLAGFAQVPIQDPAAAAAELARAVQDLGLIGAYLGTQIGRDLDDDALGVFWQACEELDVPVFLHPGTHGIDGPDLDPRLGRFDLDLTVGFLYEETVAAAQLLFGGVLHRHPGLRVCLSHGGGALGWLLERWRRSVQVRPWVPDWLREPGAFDALVGRLWFDDHTGGPSSRAFLATVTGGERLTYGTNMAGWDAPEPAPSG